MLLRADVLTMKVVRGTKQGIGNSRIDGGARLLCDNLASKCEFKCLEGLELVMPQAQAGVQECLVIFARSVEVLHQPSKVCTIKVQERGPNIAPSSAHMKEAGDAPGLQFGDPVADQDWIMHSIVRRTASLVS
jgi:hypothetical protein